MIRVEEGRGEVHREKGGERRRRTIAKKRGRSEAGITIVQQRGGMAGELHKGCTAALLCHAAGWVMKSYE